MEGEDTTETVIVIILWAAYFSNKISITPVLSYF